MESESAQYTDQWRSVLFKMKEDDFFNEPYFYYSILDDCHLYSIHPDQGSID